ncbi:MAG TPA: NAD(P)(+) transhydrogenase (Re/Si-specific) subunit beta [Candidatus Marinimicrobia bacterium]|nr:NAD(P)(+) transhydrogenase (Re/Si-specific) subunit beta [Candidatus Neomarinimicrobiota bacterium]
MNFNFELLINLGYIVASLLFIIGVKQLSSPETARRGNLNSSIGMLLAVILTLLNKDIVSYEWIILGIVLGSLIGAPAARLVKMTAMPEMVALFNGSGGIASLLVGWAVYQVGSGLGIGTMLPIFLSVLIGGITFTGSIIAYTKLAELIDGKPTIFTGQHILNIILIAVTVVLGVFIVIEPTGITHLFGLEAYWLFITVIVLAGILGILLVIPIGGADMPVVISLLNSFSGLAAAAAGFVINNNVLIVSGSLVGASGIILTNIMAKAMNRSIGNVLFSGFGATTAGHGKVVQGEVKPISAGDAYLVLESARSVVFVPGYGMAVAQAQHVVKELGDLLEANDIEVNYAIHPVAGRMPGHMNVLLAEANVEYDKLREMEDINPTMNTVDVAVVIGANDVVNPAAREDESSPIYGMPIINVDYARTVIILKRSMRSGFAGIENPLFFKENSRMLFGDAKQSIQALVSEFKAT